MIGASIRRLVRDSAGLRADILEAAAVIALGTAGVGVVFAILFLLTGIGWLAALGTGMFTGLLCTLLIMMLPFTGIASTVLSSAALAAYVAVTGMLGLNNPGWMAPLVALSGIVFLPLLAWASVVCEGRFGRA